MRKASSSFQPGGGGAEDVDYHEDSAEPEEEDSQGGSQEEQDEDLMGEVTPDEYGKDDNNNKEEYDYESSSLSKGDGNDKDADDTTDDAEGLEAKKNGYRLTKEFAEKVASRGPGKDGSLAPIVVTWANYHYLDFALNWVHHIKATGCKTYMVGAMDDEILEVLIEKGVPAFGMSSGLSLDDFGWGSSTFHKMGREKISLLQTFTKWGLDVLISDVDTVWTKDPLPYMAQYPDADILVSSDHLASTTQDGGLEFYPEAGSSANIGIMLFRPKAAKFVDNWVEELEKDPNYWDQNAFNDLFRTGIMLSEKREDRLFKVYSGTLLLGILPVSMFCSGHTYFVQNMPEKYDVEPYVIHATFQYSGTPGKRHRFREKLLWKDEESYFDHPVGFISAHHKISERLLDAVKEGERNFDLESTLPHFALVNQQLVTIRTLFALGTALGRAMVMPKLYCGMDRWWAPHDGTIPGSELELPFVCPLDHVIDLETLSADYPEDTHGPKVEWKEYSFLENPGAKEIQANKVTIITCNEHSTLCDDGRKPATLIDGNVIKLRGNRSDTEIKTALKDVIESFDLVEFENPVKLWKGFDNPTDRDKFSARYNQITSLWCCIEPPNQGQPGHIWYDLWHDVVPHTDRFSRWIDSAWKPSLGP